MNPPSPITDADLHAWADGQLAAARAREVADYLATRPDEAQRVAAWRAQARALRTLFDAVQDEPVPARLLRAAQPRPPWYARRLVAGAAVALAGTAFGWALRGSLPVDAAPLASGRAADGGEPVASAAFARRAAIAHAVYAPELRRPVEVDAAHQDQLVAWLSKRLGTAVKPPRLQALGYALEGGRLLPGGQGPVAQFMYRDDAGVRLTLYVSNELGAPADPGAGAARDTAFRFAREGAVNVFYWIDGPFGYALSAQADRTELARVSAEVYAQLAGR